MTANMHPRDDRESLSALFDGELPDDAARFALKRLDHDTQWRDTCGRWQLIGDALRGQATAAAPPDFAAGVMRALASETLATNSAEAKMAQDAPAAARAQSRRRWIGSAALAASVAVAAVLVVRPFSSPQTDDAPIAIGAPAAATQSAGNTGSAIAASATAASRENAASAQGASAAATAAVASVASLGTPKSALRQASARRTPPPSASAGGDPAPVTGERSAVAAVAGAAATPPQPFHPPTDEIVIRPWPRSALGNAGSGAFTVSHELAPSSPSFYPFDPRLASDAATDGEAQP